jgi:hypothetical protein
MAPTVSTVDLLGDVSTEGGPFLLVDRAAYRSWGGAGDGNEPLEATDYGRILRIYEGELLIGSCSSVAFDIEGPGTASVYRVGPDQIAIVRSFADETSWRESQRRFADTWREATAVLGRVDVPTGDLLIIWSPVAAGDVDSFEPGDDGASLSANAIAGLGMQVTVTPGTLVVRADRAEHSETAGVRAVVRPA